MWVRDSSCFSRTRFSCISFVMDRYPIWGMFYMNCNAWRIPSLDKVYLAYLLFLTIRWWTLLDVWFLNPLTRLLLIRLTYKNIINKKQGNLFFWDVKRICYLKYIHWSKRNCLDLRHCKRKEGFDNICSC